MKRLLAGILLTFFMTRAVFAQESVWIQIEAQPSLNTARESARGYAANLPDVNGFSLGSGWYGIALGPYSQADAEALTRQLVRERLVPRDAYVSDGGSYSQQFWPIGANTLNTAPATLPETDTANAVVVVPEVDPIQVPDETRREALASENLLTRDEKKELQVMLQWAGFYTAAIDGSYGRGTRASMTAWQEANNHEATGVMTTRQRTEIFAAYNAILDGMDLTPVRDETAGIAMLIPTGVVAFDEYEPPFARFKTAGEIPAQLLMISQEGDQNTFFGLYEILQTLEIVPTEGPRERGNSRFTLEGVNDEIHSYTVAELRDGQIKGFTLIWPAGDEERRTRVLTEIEASFERIDGVLDPALGNPGEDQAIDLISGLIIRKPTLSRSGFYLNARGSVLTTSEAIAGCARITLDQDTEAEVVFSDIDLGLAVLSPATALSPSGFATFQEQVPRLQSEVAVAGFPYEGVLTSPSLTFGKLADIRGLNGEEEIKRLALSAQSGDAGGPVFDSTGAVLGMLLPKTSLDGQSLPPEVSFIADSGAILTALADSGVTTTAAANSSSITPEMLTRQALDMTVLVSCWAE